MSEFTIGADGEPAIGGAGVEGLALRVLDGEPAAAVASACGLTRRQVLLACWYFGRTDADFGGPWKPWGRQWGQALADAADTTCEAVPDPPSVYDDLGWVCEDCERQLCICAGEDEAAHCRAVHSVTVTGGRL